MINKRIGPMKDSALLCHRNAPRSSTPVRVVTLAALLSLALGSATTLAAMDSGSRGSAGSSSSMSQSDQQPNLQQVMKASNLLHKDVKNSSGDEIASVEDLAIDLKTARVDYVILSTGGVLGAGNRMIAVPPQALQTGGASQRAGQGGQGAQTGQSGQSASSTPSGGGNAQQLTISVADNDLKSMKAVDMNQWSALSDPNFFRETYRAAGVQMPENAAPPGQLAQASKLLGADIKDRQGKSVGEINDVAVDLKSASAPFAVVAYGGILGVGTKKTAVPTPALNQAQGRNEALTIAATEDQIKSGKRIDEQQWRSVDAQWLSNMYAQYGVTPYWQTASAAGGGAQGAQGGAAGASFAALDTNKDGYISEAEARQNPSLSQAFNSVDNNKDHQIDEAEFAQFEAAPGQQSGGSSSGPAGGSSSEGQQSQQPGSGSMP